MGIEREREGESDELRWINGMKFSISFFFPLTLHLFRILERHLTFITIDNTCIHGEPTPIKSYYLALSFQRFVLKPHHFFLLSQRIQTNKML